MNILQLVQKFQALVNDAKSRDVSAVLADLSDLLREASVVFAAGTEPHQVMRAAAAAAASAGFDWKALVADLIPLLLKYL